MKTSANLIIEWGDLGVKSGKPCVTGIRKHVTRKWLLFKKFSALTLSTTQIIHLNKIQFTLTRLWKPMRLFFSIMDSCRPIQIEDDTWKLRKYKYYRIFKRKTNWNLSVLTNHLLNVLQLIVWKPWMNLMKSSHCFD